MGAAFKYMSDAPFMMTCKCCCVRLRLSEHIGEVSNELMRRTTSLYNTLFPAAPEKGAGKISGKRSYAEASSDWQSSARSSGWNGKWSNKSKGSGKGKNQNFS